MSVSACSYLIIEKDFNPSEVTWSLDVGFNEVVGITTIKEKNKKYYCDNTLPVIMVPYSRFSENKLEVLANKKISNLEKIVFNEKFLKQTIVNDSKEANKFIYQTTCTDGKYIFSGLPDGKWFLITHVVITEKPLTGYFIVNRVETKGNKTILVVNDIE